MHWSYVFLALTHRYIVCHICQPQRDTRKVGGDFGWVSGFALFMLLPPKILNVLSILQSGHIHRSSLLWFAVDQTPLNIYPKRRPREVDMLDCKRNILNYIEHKILLCKRRLSGLRDVILDATNALRIWSLSVLNIQYYAVNLKIECSGRKILNSEND